MDPTSNTINDEGRKYKRKRQWTADTPEQMLLEMWEDNILQLRDNRKNQHVYAEFAAELQKNGFSISALDVKKKIHTLTARYRKEKLFVGPSGGSTSQWPLYSRLHCLLGPYTDYNLTDDITCNSISAVSATSTEPAAASFTYESISESIYTNESAAPAPSTSRAASARPTTTAASESLSTQIGAAASASPSTQIGAVASGLPLASPTPSPLIAESSIPTLPRKKIKFQQQIINKINELNQKINNQAGKLDEINENYNNLECKKADLLDKFAKKHSAVIDAILDYVGNKK